jgi:hypothetical protein
MRIDVYNGSETEACMLWQQLCVVYRGVYICKEVSYQYKANLGIEIETREKLDTQISLI